MAANPFGIKPVKISAIDIFGNRNFSSKRTLGIRDKKILYRIAKGRCQNPTCNKKIEFDEMQVGHKIAYSKNGRTTLKNSVCLCWRCNNNQGSDSWGKYLKKQGIKVEKKKNRAKKPKRRSSGGQTWINPITGRKEKLNNFGI